MKTYNKTHLPEVISYKGQTYKLNIDATNKMRDGVKLSSRYHIKVNCLSNNLKGKNDLWGKPYKPTEWIYSNELGFLPTVTVNSNPKAVKELARIKKHGYGV